jgi:hypothetical protein
MINVAGNINKGGAAAAYAAGVGVKRGGEKAYRES